MMVVYGDDTKTDYFNYFHLDTIKIELHCGLRNAINGVSGVGCCFRCSRDGGDYVGDVSSMNLVVVGSMADKTIRH